MESFGETQKLDQILKTITPNLSWEELTDRRFHKGYDCPHCGSDHVHKHGRYRDRQRYRCVECGRTFNDRTNTPLHGTHYPEKWSHFALCTSLGLSLRRTARLLGISLPTAFSWRHKLISAVRVGTLLAPIRGVVEMDEAYVLESQKGSRRLNRPPRKRGTGRSISRGPAYNRVCVLAMADRRHNRVASVVGMGQLHVFWVEALADRLPAFEPTALCSEYTMAYWSLVRRWNLQREAFRVLSRRRGIYHYQNVDQFLNRFKKWLLTFRGVSTKYLENYVVWFLHYEKALEGGVCPRALSRELLFQGFAKPVRTRITNLFPVSESPP